MVKAAIIGSGGRESAIAWSLSRSRQKPDLYCFPGNGGTNRFGKNVEIPVNYPFNDFISFLRKERIDLVVAGSGKPPCRRDNRYP